MNLVLLEPGEVADGSVTLRDARATHLRDVVGVVPGAAVRVGIIDGPTGTGVVQASPGELAVTLRCRFDDVPPRPRVDLLLALPRPKVMRRLWAQVAALGVGRVILTNAERVERNYFDTSVLEPATYRPLLIEGLQQARDTRVPEVTIHRRFRVLIEDELDALAGAAVRVVADPRGTRSIAQIQAAPGADGRTLLAVGPEGGWNDFELALLARHRFQSVSLSQRTLRTDTACIALLALMHQRIGDW